MRLRRPWMIYGYRLGGLEIESSTGSRFLWPTKKHGLWKIFGRYKQNLLKNPHLRGERGKRWAMGEVQSGRKSYTVANSRATLDSGDARPCLIGRGAGSI